MGLPSTDNHTTVRRCFQSRVRIFVHKVQWNESQNKMNAWFNFTNNVDTCNFRSADSRAIIGRKTFNKTFNTKCIWSLSAEGSLIKYHHLQSPHRLGIVGRLTPHKPVTFGRYHDVNHDVNFFKRAALHFTDDKTPENWQISQQNFKLCRHCMIIPVFAHDCQATVSLGNVTVALYYMTLTYLTRQPRVSDPLHYMTLTYLQ